MIEIFAGFLILLTSIKIIVILIKPQAWIKFSSKLYNNPQVTSVVSLLLAAVILFFLVASGLSIIQILAVVLFVSLLMLSGMAPYVKQLIPWIEKQDIRKIMIDTWLYSLVWIGLIIWGGIELFSKIAA
jgi:hypothetical protein